MGNFDEKDLLTRELRERSADVGGHPIGLDAVRQSARKIRRRRNIVSGAVAAVVASVALPTGVAVTSAINGPDQPVKNPHVATSPSDTPAPTPRPDGTFPLTLRGLPSGDAPRADYVLRQARTLVTPEGTVDLPEAYSQIVPFQDGWMALADSKQEGLDNVRLDAELNVVERSLGGEGIVLNSDGTRLLYVVRDFNVPGRTVLVDTPAIPGYERDQVTWDMPSGRWLVPVGYLGEGRAVVQALDGEDPYVALVVDDADPHVSQIKGFSHVTAVSEAKGLLAGVVSYDDLTGSTCSEVVDPVEDTTVRRTCDYEIMSFSPDGSHAVAAPSEGDGQGPSALTVLDTTTWKPVATFTPPKDTVVAVQGTAWEDDDTVLAVLVEGNDYGIVRAGIDGRLELTTKTVTSNDMTKEMWFTGTPGSLY